MEPAQSPASAIRSHRTVKAILIALFVAAVAVAAPDERKAERKAGRASAPRRDDEVRLGARLFSDPRFSTPRGDLPASCSNCHLIDQDPQGLRAYTDFLSKSWVSARLADPRRNELRNTPTLFDVDVMPRLHFDGEFGSLEDLVTGTLTGRPMGWLPGEESQALDQIRRVVTGDADASYLADFKRVFVGDAAALGRDEVARLVARAISTFMRTLKSPRRSPYDEFIALNRLPAEPGAGEPAKSFGTRLLASVRAVETGAGLRLPAGFDRASVEGLRIFLSNGNCVACHAPPLFSDFSFHNTGISQSEYDSVHGEGAFGDLAIPGASEAVRPSTRFRETPSRGKLGEVDLGHWNFVDLKASPLRRHGEDDERFLRRMIGAFKTPTLRHLARTQPYMHTGAFANLEDALSEIMRLSRLARAGRVRQADDELRLIQIDESHIRLLVSFLNSLNEPLPAPNRARK